MAFWYSGILALILILAGILVYAAMAHVLIGPVAGDVQYEAQEQTAIWLSHALYAQQHGLQVPAIQLLPEECNLSGGPSQWIVACYDPSGAMYGENDQAKYNSAFDSNELARDALRSPTGTATDQTTGTVTFPQQNDSQGQPTGNTPSSDEGQATSATSTVARYAEVVPGPNGKPLGVVVVGVDITANVHALDVLRLLLLVVGGLTLLAAGGGGVLLANRALQPARLAFARQQTFIADASHELRTPLTLMRANAEVLLSEDTALPAEDAQLLHALVAEVEHMGAVTTRLLELARLDAGETHPEQEIIHLGALATSLAGQTRALAEARGVKLDLAVESDPVVIGDHVQLTEVSLILLDNAIKYNVPNGGVTLRVSQNADIALLSVTDTGPGIPAEHLARLGERFYRVDKARSRKMGGAGLGLAIAQRIAALHGGQLSLSSEEGKGTTATLALPVAHVG